MIAFRIEFAIGQREACGDLAMGANHLWRQPGAVISGNLTDILGKDDLAAGIDRTAKRMRLSRLFVSIYDIYFILGEAKDLCIG